MQENNFGALVKAETPQTLVKATHALSHASEAFFAIKLGIERLEEPDLIAFAA